MVYGAYVLALRFGCISGIRGLGDGRHAFMIALMRVLAGEASLPCMTQLTFLALRLLYG